MSNVLFLSLSGGYMGVDYIILSFNKLCVCVCACKNSGKPIMCFRVVVSEFFMSKTYQEGYLNYLVTTWSTSVNVRIQRRRDW